MERVMPLPFSLVSPDTPRDVSLFSNEERIDELPCLAMVAVAARGAERRGPSAPSEGPSATFTRRRFFTG